MQLDLFAKLLLTQLATVNDLNMTELLSLVITAHEQHSLIWLRYVGLPPIL